MADNMEVVISAIDSASEVFSQIASSCEEMMGSIAGSADEASESIDYIAPAAEEVESAISSIDSSVIDEASSAADVLSDSLGNVDGSNLGDAASGADELGDSLGGASGAADELGNSLGIIEGSMLLGAAEQIGNLAGNTEKMAQEMNTAAISVGQLATQTGIAEPQMVSLISEISNATFPQEEAMMYVKSLDQIGVSSENLGKSATDLDRINDAFGMGAGKVNSLGQELSVLGVDMNNVSDSFNALAYANANTVGGMDNYYNFLRKYDAQFKELGYDVDQSSIIIAAATQKYGGGKAALSGLSEALEEADGDTRKLEEALGIQAGTLDHASDVTGQYEGQLQELANEEAEHKTILDQIGAAWEDVTLHLSGVLSPAAAAIGAIGEVGSLGMSIKGIKELSTTFNQLKETKYGMAAANYVQAASETVLSGATAAYGVVVGVLTGEIGLAEAATMAWNAVLAMNPLVLVAVAAVALAVAVYEVGKAFGWWTDVSSMIDAIWAGIQRLWAAFINHPDVQAIISIMSQAWNVLSSAIGAAINWVMSFFNTNTGGEFDIIRALINAVSLSWKMMTTPIRLVINVIKIIISWFKQTGNQGKSTTQLIRSAFAALPGLIRAALSGLLHILTKPFTDAYSSISKTVGNIKSKVSGLTNINISSITNKITQPFTDAYNKVVGIVDDIKAKAKSIPVIGNLAAGSYDLELELNGGALDLETGESFNIYTGQSYEVEEATDINLNEKLEVVFDFKHVPDGFSEDNFLDMLEEFITETSVINRLVNDPRFQSLDSKVKDKILAKAKRAKGV